MIFVDSSIYIDWLRARVEMARILEPWIQTRSIATCGVIRAEVVRGILTAAQKERIQEFFDLLEEIPTDGKTWREASELAWMLDRRGIVVPLSDVVIASCAQRAGATLISTDAHFTRIPGLTMSRTLPPFG